MQGRPKKGNGIPNKGNVIRKGVCLPNFAEHCQSFGTGSLLTSPATLLTMVKSFLIFCFLWFYQKEVEIIGNNFVIVRYNNVREYMTDRRLSVQKERFVQYSASTICSCKLFTYFIKMVPMPIGKFFG